MKSTGYSRQIKKNNFTDKLLNETINPKYHKIRPVGVQLFRTDTHNVANRRFSQFCPSF